MWVGQKSRSDRDWKERSNEKSLTENKKTMNREDSRKLLVKGIFIVLVTVGLQIPSVFVKLAVSGREDMSDKANREVAESWGGNQIIHAPEIIVPYVERYYDEYAERDMSQEKLKTTVADEVTVKGTASVEMLHRGIYDIPVYRTELAFDGVFIPDAGLVAFARQKGECWLDFRISHRNGIDGKIVLVMDGHDYDLESSGSSLRARIPLSRLNAGQPMHYTMKMTVKGMETLDFVPNAGAFTAVLVSEYDSPSFHGAFLPAERNVTDDGFEARWSVNDVNMYDGDSDAYKFGVDFFVPVSMYQQTDRALKYSVLVILLIFMGIFIVERLTGKSVSIIQYIVTGLSLCLFYLLLLAFTEYMSFAAAYLIASLMTVLALGVYFKAILKSASAYFFAGSVAVLYAFIYLLLTLETGSLLIGTLALFFILCAVMYFTRNVNKQENFVN